MKLVPLLYRARVAKGVDWGVDRIVLARVDGKELWWLKGHLAWDGNYVPRRYEPARIYLASDPGSNLGEYVQMQVESQVRRTPKFFRDNATAINKFFGCDVAHLLDAKHTVVSNVGRLPADLKEVKI